MNKKYEIRKEHLEEIRQARKQTKDKREDRRLRAVELRILGYTNEEIVEKVQVHERTVIRWIQNYAEHGIEGLRIINYSYLFFGFSFLRRNEE